jgi:hypothetical protein
MSRSKLSFGFIGIAAMLVLLVITLISIFRHETYSLLNGFITELGKYPGAYMGSTNELVFNIGLVASGLLLCLFMVGFGIVKRNSWFVATSFFGVITGVLIAAQGVITLNVPAYHYLFTFALFISAAVMSVLIIVATLAGEQFTISRIADILVATAAAVASIIFAVFVQIGNMPQILSVPLEKRIAVIPFTIIGWAALLLIFVLATLLAIRLLLDKGEYEPKPRAVKPTPEHEDLAPREERNLKMPQFREHRSKENNNDF